jgi:hypothetical protein
MVRKSKRQTRKTSRSSKAVKLPAIRKERLPAVVKLKGNHKHTPLAMEFYRSVHGHRDLPPTGIEVAKDKFDQFGAEHDMLPLASIIDATDPRYSKAQNDRDKLRKKINSGACCIDVNANRQFQIEVNRGKLIMLPAGDLARNKLENLGEIAMRGVQRSLAHYERILTVQMLTAVDEVQRQRYEFAIHEMGYARDNIKSTKDNLTKRGRNIAGALPGR